MARLRKMHGKYYVRIYVDKKEKLLPTGTSVKAEALPHLRRVQREEIEIKQRIRNEYSDLKKRTTISEAVKYFTDHVGNERNLKDTTIDSYKLACNNFKNCFKNNTYFDELDKTSITKLVEYLTNKYKSLHTVNIRLRSIRAMINYLYEKEIIKRKPFKVRTVKIDKEFPKFIKPDILNKIYKKVKNDKMLATFKVFEITGMRLGEFENSHRDGDFIIVKKSKGRKQRIIPIPLEYIPIYDSARDNPYSTDYITHKFKKACDDAGIKGHSLHSLRHTFALRKLLETNNISIVKELLGHSSVQVSEIYTQFPMDYLSQVLNERKVNKKNPEITQA